MPGDYEVYPRVLSDWGRTLTEVRTDSYSCFTLRML